MCIIVEIVTFREFFRHYNMMLLIEFGKNNNNFTGLELMWTDCHKKMFTLLLSFVFVLINESDTYISI